MRTAWYWMGRTWTWGRAAVWVPIEIRVGWSDDDGRDIPGILPRGGGIESCCGGADGGGKEISSVITAGGRS